MKIKLFLAGDVMVGRGIDQILPYPSPPHIYEPAVGDAREYVELAENVSGKINYPVPFEYVWGDALPELEKARPALKIINLETTATRSENYLPKGINYRMRPKNIGALKVPGIHACVLANNHILDYGPEGLAETIDVLESRKIRPVGAGRDLAEAERPAVFNFNGSTSSPQRRVIIFAYAHPSSGVPLEWQAQKTRPGLNLMADLSEKEINEINREAAAVKQKGDFVVFSIHWGPNWGYEVGRAFRNFAHGLIDRAGIDLVFGHSSHHFKGLEIYRGRLILYGAGDFINDYEGIGGYEEFRGNLSLMYFPEIEWETKNLTALTLVPMQIKKFRLNFPQEKDIDWCRKVLQKESKIDGKFDKEGRYLLWRGKTGN